MVAAISSSLDMYKLSSLRYLPLLAAVTWKDGLVEKRNALCPCLWCRFFVGSIPLRANAWCLKKGRADERPHKKQWFIFMDSLLLGDFLLLLFSLADLLSCFHMIVIVPGRRRRMDMLEKRRETTRVGKRTKKIESIQRSVGFESFLSVDQLTIH